MSASSPEQNGLTQPGSLRAKADDPGAVLDSVVEAASFSANLWLSYLFLLLYLLVSVGGVRQQDLFLENPVQLPVFAVAMPIQGFFWLGPIIFVIIHAYILLHISLLAEKIGIFNESLEAAYPGRNDQAKIRRQLPNNIFVHFLAGPPEARNGVFGILLTLIVWISMVIGPVSLLIFFQLQFLPFHDFMITTIQRFAVMADLALLWVLWPTTVRGAMIGKKVPNKAPWSSITVAAARIFALAIVFVKEPKKAPWSSAVVAAVSIVSFALVFVIATFPGERLNTWLADLPGVSGARAYLVHGAPDLASGRPTSIWTDRLVLVNFDAIDHTKFNTEADFAAVQSTYSLTGRDFREAVFANDDLRQMDFSAANLEKASFDNSILRDAQFNCTYQILLDSSAYHLLEEAKPGGPPPGIEFKIGSGIPDHVCAKLEGANFTNSDLRGADFEGAQLQDAFFWHAKLEAANLNGANLDHANFSLANLEAASLRSADLDGTHFLTAKLQGATLVSANLENANLSSAVLLGSSLDNADLSKADLDGAQFVYASLQSTNFDKASFGISFFVNANLRAADLNDASIDQADFYDSVLDSLSPPQVQSALAQRYSVATTTKYEDGLADIWKQLGCSAVDAPYVLKGLIVQMTSQNPFGPASPQLSQLATAFLRTDCKGNVGLSDTDLTSLESLVSPPVAQQ